MTETLASKIISAPEEPISEEPVPTADEQKLSERGRQLWDYIQSVKVGNQLRFNATHVSRVKEELGLKSREHVYGILKGLEAKGRLRRLPLSRGKGIMLIFGEDQPRDQKPQTPENTTVADLLARLRAEIEEIKAEIDKREKKVKGLQQEITDKKDHLERKEILLAEISSQFPSIK